MRAIMDEVKTGSSSRHPRWAELPDEKWCDWKWQMANRLHRLSDLNEIIRLTPEETKALESDHLFRVDITPFFASLIDPVDPACPVRQQVVPRAAEAEAFQGREEDSTSEELKEPVRGVVHKYPDRLIMILTSECASYCRYCTRSRFVGDRTKGYSNRDYEAQLDYVRKNPQVRDVLLTGGDPMVLASYRIEHLLAELRAIPHVEIIRIGTRAPVFNPFCITQDFCDMLEKYHPVWMNLHINHPRELTPELKAACSRLLKAGVPLGNQSVLLAGVNDSVAIQRKLCTELVRMRVRPYYLYQCDSVKGAGHFRTDIRKGLEIMEGLRGHITGFAVPTYVVDSPAGGGKVPVMPNYLMSLSENRAVLRNFRGEISVYTGPTDYGVKAKHQAEGVGTANADS
jgi:lysine 2,3-aminomutase